MKLQTLAYEDFRERWREGKKFVAKIKRDTRTTIPSITHHFQPLSGEWLDGWMDNFLF